MADDVPVSEIVYRDEEMFVLRQDCVDRVDFYAQASSAQMLAIVRVSFNAQAVTNIESHEFPFDGEPGVVQPDADVGKAVCLVTGLARAAAEKIGQSRAS